jgi:hypothetical protein
MLSEARSGLFRFRVNLWSRLTGRGRFDWTSFERHLEESEFRRFAGIREALQSLGWVGKGTSGRWLFGVAGFRIPLYGKSAMRHELFHAAQDFKTGLFDREPRLVRSLSVEYSAHLWGGPLVGVPLAYGGTVFIVVGLAALIYLLVGAF